VTVITAIVVVWFFTCYLLIAKKIKVTQQAIHNDICFLKNGDKKQKQCQTLTGDIHLLKKKLQYTYWKDSSHGQSLALLMDAAHHNGIVLRDCTLGTCKKKKKNIQQSIDCVFSATFDQLIIFFDFLYTQKVPVKCVQLNMQGGDPYEVQLSLKLYEKESPSTLEKS